MYNAKEDTCISTVSQHLIAVVLSEMRNDRNWNISLMNFDSI